MGTPIFRLASKALLLLVLATASACGWLSKAPSEQETEASAWGYTGRPTNVFLSQHGLGNLDESLAYYDRLVPSGESPQTFTLAKWKAEFIDSGPVVSAFYRNTIELGFWREMTCSKTIARGVGGCMVTNWVSPNEPTSGAPDHGTVTMNVSPEGYARFYVFLPGGKLSPTAVLDSEGPKFHPRLCTVCHSGANPQPGQNPDLGGVFREFDMPLLEERPGLPRIQAEQEWRQLNNIAYGANRAIRSEREGAAYGTDHAKAAIEKRMIELIVTSGTSVLYSDRATVPDSWINAGSEATTLWTQTISTYCMGCHRHNDADWSIYDNFKFLQDGSIRSYLPRSPAPEVAVPAMPQAELTFTLLSNDRAAQAAVDSWLGAVACGGGCQPPLNGKATCLQSQCVISCNVGFDACTLGCCATDKQGDDETIAASGRHTCGIRADSVGSLACWGENLVGQSTPPLSVRFAAVTTGDSHTCAITSDGKVECWGSNGFDQAKPPLGTFRAVSAGAQHTCGVRSDGTLACWGSNGAGLSDAPPGIFRSVSAGGQFSCGIRSDETIQCWGRLPPGPIPTGAFLAVSVTNIDDNGSFGACAIKADETVVCWGANQALKAVPAAKFRSISVGAVHACGVRNDGWVACWGDERSGDATPAAGTFRSVSAGSFHTCGVRTDGRGTCWGSNVQNQSAAPNVSFR